MLAICVGFFGFLWSGEFTATRTCNSNHVISVADISLDSHSNPQVVTITLHHSKTDKAGKGSNIYLGRTGDRVCRRTGDRVCPVTDSLIQTLSRWKSSAFTSHTATYNLAPIVSPFLVRDFNKGTAEITGKRVNHSTGYGSEALFLVAMFPKWQAPSHTFDKRTNLVTRSVCSYLTHHSRTRTCRLNVIDSALVGTTYESNLRSF